MKVLTARQMTAWRKKNTVPENVFEKTFDNWWYTRGVEGKAIDEKHTKGVLVVWAARCYSATQKKRGTVLKALVEGERNAFMFDPHIGFTEKAVPTK